MSASILKSFLSLLLITSVVHLAELHAMMLLGDNASWLTDALLRNTCCPSRTRWYVHVCKPQTAVDSQHLTPHFTHWPFLHPAFYTHPSHHRHYQYESWHVVALLLPHPRPTGVGLVSSVRCILAESGYRHDGRVYIVKNKRHNRCVFSLPVDDTRLSCPQCQ